jgi:diamine N-acetyltransferase
MQLLKGQKVFLRALEPSDIDEVYQWENDSSIWHLSNTISPYSRFVLEQYLAEAHQDIFTAKQLRLVICLPAVAQAMTQQAGLPTVAQARTQQAGLPAGKAIGCIDIFDFDPLHQRAGVGVLIAEEADRGKGFASEALQLLIEYCRDTIHLHQLYCNITEGNESSKKLFTNLGFCICGTKKSWLREKDGWKDELMLQKML